MIPVDKSLFTRRSEWWQVLDGGGGYGDGSLCRRGSLSLPHSYTNLTVNIIISTNSSVSHI